MIGPAPFETIALPPPLLAWAPFFQPLNFFFDWGFLLAIPLAFFISVTYKAMRVNHYHRYWRRVTVMTLQILVGMVVLQVGLFVLIEFILPILPAR